VFLLSCSGGDGSTRGSYGLGKNHSKTPGSAGGQRGNSVVNFETRKPGGKPPESTIYWTGNWGRQGNQARIMLAPMRSGKLTANESTSVRKARDSGGWGSAGQPR